MTKLQLTPQLRQAIRYLQISTLDLREEVQQALDSNMMLEVSEEIFDDSVAQVSVEPLDIPRELDVDAQWDDIYEPERSAAPAASDGGELEEQCRSDETLSDHLRWQLEISRFSERDHIIGAAIVDAVDDDGYLETSLERLHEGLAPALDDLDIEELGAVLRQVQNFDPPGVAARDLRECLLIQLRQLDEAVPWSRQAIDLVDTGFDSLASKDFTQLTRVTRLSREALHEAMRLVHSLNPRPGTTFNSAPTEYPIPHLMRLVQHLDPQPGATSAPAPAEYVNPDLIVTKRQGTWVVELNPEAMPRIQINSSYADLIRRENESPDRAAMRAHLQEARHFIKSLQNRSRTLLKVARCVVKYQEAFLEHGDAAIKAMVPGEVAQMVGLHQSTVSRVSSQKYILTPRGLYELRQLFFSDVFKRAESPRDEPLRVLLREFIAKEDPRRPFSDNKLAVLFKERGFVVGPRIIAVYRQSMSIPPPRIRRRPD